MFLCIDQKYHHCCIYTLILTLILHSINHISPKPRKILQLLRLLQIHNGVFVRLNNATIQMLRLVEPYVAYGYPSLKAIRELVYKRGHAKINDQRIPLTDNQIIEAALGKHGIVCMEDIVHEIFTAGKNFKAVSTFLWPFQLNAPRGGFHTRKAKHFIEGGDHGNRENHINELIHKMN